MATLFGKTSSYNLGSVPSVLTHTCSIYSAQVVPCFYKGDSDTFLYDTELHKDGHNFLAVKSKLEYTARPLPYKVAGSNQETMRKVVKIMCNSRIHIGP